VLKIGSDSRFDTIRAHFFQFLGAASECYQFGGNLLIEFCYGRDRFLDLYVAPSSFGYCNCHGPKSLAAQILWVHNTRHVVTIKEVMLTSRDGSGLDRVPARRRAQFARCVRPCARWIKSSFRHCPRYRGHRVMGTWIGHRDRDRCAKGASSYLVSRATMVVELMCLSS
jgi:hypothetical protein